MAVNRVGFIISAMIPREFGLKENGMTGTIASMGSPLLFFFLFLFGKYAGDRE